MDYMKLLDLIGEQYQEVLKSNLIGIYVHGSIAFGCYNPEKSDIDFLVVVKEEPTLQDKMKLIKILLELDKEAPKKGFEMSVVCKDICCNFVYPTPFVLHYSNLHRNRCKENLEEYCETMSGTDVDLAAHFTVIRQVGYVLIGQPVGEVFGEVPRKFYLDSITNDIVDAKEDIKEQPVYIILNLCRVLGYIAEEKVMSKEQGGEWGINHLPKKYTSIVQTALTEYRSKTREKLLEFYTDSSLTEFCNYMMRCIFKTEY